MSQYLFHEKIGEEVSYLGSCSWTLNQTARGFPGSSTGARVHPDLHVRYRRSYEGSLIVRKEDPRLLHKHTLLVSEQNILIPHESLNVVAFVLSLNLRWRRHLIGLDSVDLSFSFI